MKRLGLFRHAKSDWSDASQRDFDRGLNARGRKAAALMGRHIADHGIVWQRAIASPALRVRETLALAAEAAADRDTAWPLDWQDRLYLASSGTLLDTLRSLDDGLDDVMVCGHNPGLEELLHALAPPVIGNPLHAMVADKFPTGAFAVVELDIGSWHDLAPGCGQLVHVALPRRLAAEPATKVPGQPPNS